MRKVDQIELERMLAEHKLRISGKSKQIVVYNQYLDLRHTDFRGMQLQGMDFQYTNLQHSSFEGVPLEHTVFDHSELGGANFEYAVFKNTSFHGSYLQGIDLWYGCFCEYPVYATSNSLQIGLVKSTWGDWFSTIPEFIAGDDELSGYWGLFKPVLNSVQEMLCNQRSAGTPEFFRGPSRDLSEYLKDVDVHKKFDLYDSERVFTVSIKDLQDGSVEVPKSNDIMCQIIEQTKKLKNSSKQSIT